MRSPPRGRPDPERPAIPAVSSGSLARLLAAACLGIGPGLGTFMPAFAQVSPGALSRPHADLDGTLKCFMCHGSGRDAMDGKCLDCHEGIAWLRERGRGLHGRAGLGDCASCHPDHAGVDFELIEWEEEGSPDRFDHARSGWPLAGRHAALECRQCHQPKHQISEAARLGPRSARGPRWIGLETQCRACHEDVHTGALGEDCLRCHDQSRWTPAPNFDHARTEFALEGRHASVRCDGCHRAAHLDLPRGASGSAAPIYKPLAHEECSACHRDAHEGRLGPTCASCHTAEDFHRVAEGRFDHARTRYALRGAHAPVACAKCHDAKTAGGRRPPHDRCGACHGDAHAGQAALAGEPADCAACHSENGWRPSTFTVAQHAESPYPLEGRHRKVACDSCHAKSPPGAAPASLGSAGVRIREPHARCADCHANAHGGQLAARSDRSACESCHGVQGWRPSLFALADHRDLRLPLDGRHAEVACSACHGPDRPGLPPLSGETDLGTARVALELGETACADCHSDPHDGRFGPEGLRQESASAGTSRCLECHDTRAFGPSRVDVDRHQRFSFALEGAHRTVPCNACHKELNAPPAEASLVRASAGGRRLDFAQNRARCVECHESPHGDQFARRSDAGACSGCHGVDRFRPATRFDHVRDASFRLEGAHARVACAACHGRTEADDGKTRIVYRPTPARCEACHSGRRGAGSAAPRSNAALSTRKTARGIPQ